MAFKALRFSVLSFFFLFFLHSEDKGALAKLVEAIKTNYNDRYEEVSFNVWCLYFRNILEDESLF